MITIKIFFFPIRSIYFLGVCEQQNGPLPVVELLNSRKKPKDFVSNAILKFLQINQNLDCNEEGNIGSSYY